MAAFLYKQVKENITSMRKLSLYFHIPFCKKRCLYCDFYSNTDCSSTLKDSYTNSLIKTLDAPFAHNEYEISTIYFGGGTPTALGATNICAILDAVKQDYVLTPNCEITVETNPNSTDFETLYALREAGVNRLSIGAQSFDDDVLFNIGRTHSSDDVLSCVEIAQKADFDNISLDLMFGLPEQSISLLTSDIIKATSLGDCVKHLSLYCLKLEEGTQMYAHRNKFDFPDEDEEADMYLAACEQLRQNGFEHYEISNFARNGFRSAHNMNYWQCGEFVGFGASAYSRLNSRLFSTERDLHCYIELADKGKNIFEITDYNSVTPMSNAEEDEIYIIMSLRTSDGLSVDRLHEPEKFIKKAARHISSGIIEINNGKYILNEKAYFVSNSILSTLI